MIAAAVFVLVVASAAVIAVGATRQAIEARAEDRRRARGEVRLLAEVARYDDEGRRRVG